MQIYEIAVLFIPEVGIRCIKANPRQRRAQNVSKAVILAAHSSMMHLVKEEQAAAIFSCGRTLKKRGSVDLDSMFSSRITGGYLQLGAHKSPAKVDAAGSPVRDMSNGRLSGTGAKMAQSGVAYHYKEACGCSH